MTKLATKVILACIIIALSISLTGCYGRNEIEEAAFILAFGIEKGKTKEYKLIIQIPSPAKIAGSSSGGGGGGGSEEQPYWLAWAEADTLFECFRELSKRSSRRLHFSHAAAVIVDEAVARRGIGPLIDIFTRNAQMRPDTNIFITSEPVEDILRVTYPLETLPSAYLTRLQAFRHQHGETTEFEVGDFYTTSQVGVEAVIPRVSTWKEPPQSAQQRGGGGQPKEEKPPAKELIIEGAAAFRSDRMLDWLDGKDVFGLEIINSRELSSPLIVEVDGSKFSISIRESYTKINISPNLADLGSSTVELDLNIETDLAEVERGGLMITNDLLHKIAVTAEEQVNCYLRNLIRKAKYELESDILGLGEQVRRKVPYRVWHSAEHNWNELFPNLIVELNTNVIVRRVGMTVRSPYIE